MEEAESAEALAERFHNEGARGVVVVDRDADNADRVAQGIGGTAVGLDVTDEAGIVDLVNQTVKDYGTLDVFVSNAGYVTQGGLEAENAEIQRMWEVHADVPRLRSESRCSDHGCKRRRISTEHSFGCGSAHTTRFTAVFDHESRCSVPREFLLQLPTENVAKVSVLCPQAVETNILASSPDQLDQDRGTPGSAAGDGVLTAEQLADTVMDCMAEERFGTPAPRSADLQRTKGERRRSLD